MPNDPLVYAENLVKAFKAKTAVSNLSFSLNKGEILSLLGPNGAGKTTTIKMLLGLIIPDSGIVTVCGQNMTVEKELRSGLMHTGVVLEGSRNSYWRLTALENLLYFGRLKGIPRTQIKGRALELLAFLGLSQEADVEVRKFSRGMQQKLALAIAMLNDPHVLILDEPTLGLDIQSARILEEKISGFAQQGKAIILTTHTMSLAEKLATHILVIHKGKRVAYGEKHHLLKQFNARTTFEVHLEMELPQGIKENVRSVFPAIDFVYRENRNPCLLWLEPEQEQIIKLLSYLDEQQQIIKKVLRRESDLEEIFLRLTGAR